MAEEISTTNIPAGTALHIHTNAPAKEAAPVRADKRTEKQAEKREQRDAEKSEAKGQNKLLKAMGIEKSEREGLLADVKKSRSAKALADKLTAESKAETAAAKTALATALAEKETYDSTLKMYADEQFSALPDSVQKYIAATSGDDLHSRLKAIKIAKDAGIISPAVAKDAVAAVKAEETAPKKPATTLAEGNPLAPVPQPTMSKAAAYKALRATNPRQAAQFYGIHQSEIDQDIS